MPLITNLILIYVFPFLIVLIIYVYFHQQREKQALAIRKEQANASGSMPVSLHPVIESTKCMGCANCVAACPEKNVIGIINRRAVLLSPSKCIGHGACKAACPFDAISLVFGTEKFGVDIPFLKPNFETNVSGIFIAGELGGMGLIRNAIEQGRQAMDTISAIIKKKAKSDGVYDVVIVGAGPAGFSASLSAMDKGLNYITFERETLGGTVAHYPRGKIVMTHPAVLPTVGKTKFRETTKEELLKFWQDVETNSGVKINYCEYVEKVVREQEYITVTTRKESYKTQAMLLTIGRGGTPRKLGVPGEEKNKVVYRLVDAAQYESRHVLVVGGGNSALEAAISLAETAGVTATLSCFTAVFGGVKQENLEKVLALEAKRRLNILFNANVKEIKEHEVVIDQAGKQIELKNDAVLVCIGGILPTGFLKDIGIQVEKKYGTA